MKKKTFPDQEALSNQAVDVDAPSDFTLKDEMLGGNDFCHILTISLKYWDWECKIITKYAD